MKSAPSQPGQPMPQNYGGMGRMMSAFRPQGYMGSNETMQQGFQNADRPQFNGNALAAMLMRLGGLSNQQGATQPTTQDYQAPPMPPQGNQFTQGAPWQSIMAQMRGWGRQ